jgi:dTDP-4-dehydrorhamnose 3,5-epimerase
MKFHETAVYGAHVIEPERRGDTRGFFARFFCEKEFAAAGAETRFVQVNNAFSGRKGTLRGLHYQLGPSAEAKVTRCVQGSFYYVIADLRPDSPTFGRWFGTELNSDNRLMMYVPRGCATGMITLADDSESLYLVSDFYAPERERGIRHDDPWLGIEWPVEPVEISPKDRAWPDFDPADHALEPLRGLIGRRGAMTEEAAA